MQRTPTWPRAAAIISALGLILAIILAGCGGSSGSGTTPPPQQPPPAITVALTPTGGDIPAGTTQKFTAQVENDASSAGVHWAVIPATGAGSMTDVTTTSMTYVAPASTPPQAIPVMVTASSVADPSKTASVTFNIPPLEVVVYPSGDGSPAYSATVPAATNKSFTAMIFLDSNPKPSGVTWSLSPASGAGTLTNATSTSVTYSAPSAAPDSDQPVTLTATSIENPLSSWAVQITVPAIEVVVAPATATMKARDSQAFIATLKYDPNATPGGVTWALSPASGIGTLSSATSTSVTYNAPTSVPPSDLQATLTATAVDNTHSATRVPITVHAIAVAVSPATALMSKGSKITLKATADGDPANAGVTWSLLQDATSCAPACGSITVVDALTVTYTAPAAVPANPTVTVKAVSVTDTTKYGSAVISLAAGTVELAPLALDLGSAVGLQHNKTMSVTLTNSGNSTLTVSSVSIAGTQPAANPTFPPFTYSSACGDSVASGASCDIAVTLHGSASYGTGGVHYNADLQIVDSSPDSPQLVKLSGTQCRKDGCGATAMALHAALATTARIAAPRPTGPSAVGTRTVKLTDNTRADPLRKDVGVRELMVRFWYPASVARDCSSAPYAAPAAWGYFSQLASVRLPKVITNSCQDAAVQDGAYPVVVFTHGYTGTYTDYTYLFEELASRGYIVASVNHTYEATATVMPDGRVLKSVYGSHIGGPLRADSASLSQALAVRLADLKFVADELDRIDRDPSSPLSGHLDIARMAVAGHSLGGKTALEAQQRDERFRAAISIDGMVPDDSFQPTSRPVLILDAGRELWPTEERRLWGQLKGPRYAVNLKKAEHITPSDAVWLARGVVRTGRMSPEQVVAATREYVVAFLDSQLLSRPVDRLLTHPSPRYPEVELTQPSR